MHTKTLAMVLSGLVVLWGCGGSGGGTEPPVGLLDTEGSEDTRGEDAAADAADAGLDLGFADIPGDVAPECRAVPFGFGCPCEDNGDCASGFCVDGPFGGVCTESCLEECPEGWHCKGVSGIGPDLVFLCVPDSKKLCYPCDRDTQCGGGVCHALEDGSFCTYACDEATKCPATFHCEEVQDGGQAWSVCLPDSGSCACTAETEGQLRPCQAESTFGVCLGYETCDPDLGWVDCSAGEPAEETCDGKDNDCDGAFDEDLPETMPCENSVEGIGTCTGVATCLGPQGWVCSAGVPGIEVCDFLDNDCDGETDEDFKVDGKYGTQNHCGTCGHDCTGAIPNALSACDASLQTPLCVVGECDPGYFQLNEFQCLPEGETLCKPCVEDFQCEGGKCIPVGGAASCVLSCDQEPCPETFACTTVEGLEGSWCLPESGTCDCTGITGPVTKPCSQANEVGICFGVHSCDPTVGWSECTAPAAAAETCNGLDDDCDGVPDDGLPQNVPCQKVLEGVGTCTGVENCFGAQGFLCSATEPAAETCDYKDNDCDGESDEAFLADGKYATLEHCGACGQSCEGALPNATAYCDSGPSVPDCKVLECLPGFYQLNAYQCILPPDVQCKPCLVAADCFADACVTIDDAKYCLPHCDGGTCPDGFTCNDLGAQGEICVPLSGSCECSADTLGSTRSCSQSSPAGTCFGLETCTAQGWSACSAATPAPEVCDGGDNDCDGLADEGIPQGQPCDLDNVFGTCPGVTVCGGAMGMVCQGQEPAAEQCDYQDNDCDGATDEDFKNAAQKYWLDGHCGTCNNSCVDAIDNATGICDPTYLVPKCVVEECDPGYAQVSPFQCVIPPDTTCQSCQTDADCVGSPCVTIDGKLRCAMPCEADGDCGGETACLPYPGKGNLCQPVSGSCECSSFTNGAKRSCSRSNAIGTCYGFETCDGGEGWDECDALEPSGEICNGVDDDCNGLIDDGLPQTMPCEKGNNFGTCQGVAVCMGLASWLCQAPVPAAEVCDYQDNNCNGAVDEDFKNAQGKYAAFEHCGTCTISCEGGFPNATAKCDASKATPACVVEECDDGYYLLNEFQCIPDTAGLCETCSTDENCVLQGAKCVDLGNGEKFCSKHCTGAGDCPAGYTCQSYAGDTQCIPDTGSCSCDGSNLQLSRSCSLTWPPAPGPGEPFTTCYGTEHCTLTGWGGCQLPSEVCDNLDNNCDGAVDEGFVNGDGKYYTTQHCGQCNNNCTFLSFPHASSVCNASQAVPVCAMSCQGNWFDVNGNPVDGCECQYTSATDVPDGTDQNCDGVDGEVGNAIFVAKNGSDASAGTMAAPMLTIQAAIQRAVSTGKRDVYVATGVYTQAITLAAGVQVYGGFSSDFKQRNKLLYETVIMGTAFSPSTPAAVNAFNLTGAPGTTALDGFTVYGKSNYSSGGTSYAVYLRNCGNAVRFTGNTVVSGNGGAGAQGTSGADRVPAASGGPGVNAYTAAWNNCTENKIKDGGEGGENTCGTTVVGGGDGGDAWCPNPPNIWVNPIQQNPPDAGENGVDGSGGETAEGGDAGWDGQLWNSCMTCSVQSNHPQEGLNGEAGEDGDLGDPGPGCTQETGQVTGGLWSSLGGQAGTAGAHGGGGGGGGAGRSAAADAPCTEQIGGTGGGGGAGGCAGTGGTGGTGGGGSFGLFLYFPSVPASIPTVSGNLFEGGVGGTGGLGGTGGTGGTGGAGGTGGTDSNLFCALGGGTGGDGGNGGHGGGGGGGCGGVSYCIFSSGQGAVSLAGYKAPANTFITGAHGSGGDGGPSVGDAGLDGDDGASAATSF